MGGAGRALYHAVQCQYAKMMVMGAVGGWTADMVSGHAQWAGQQEWAGQGHSRPDWGAVVAMQPDPPNGEAVSSNRLSQPPAPPPPSPRP